MKKTIEIRYEPENEKMSVVHSGSKVFALLDDWYSDIKNLYFNYDFGNQKITYEAIFKEYDTSAELIDKKDIKRLKKRIEEFSKNLKVTKIKIKESE